MRKDLKNRSPIGSAVDIKKLQTLRKYSKESKIPMSRLLDEALDLLFEHRNIEIDDTENEPNNL